MTRKNKFKTAVKLINAKIFGGKIYTSDTKKISANVGIFFIDAAKNFL